MFDFNHATRLMASPRPEENNQAQRTSCPEWRCASVERKDLRLRFTTAVILITALKKSNDYREFNICSVAMKTTRFTDGTGSKNMASRISALVSSGISNCSKSSDVQFRRLVTHRSERPLWRFTTSRVFLSSSCYGSNFFHAEFYSSEISSFSNKELTGL
jgi:hypothetical protein